MPAFLAGPLVRLVDKLLGPRVDCRRDEGLRGIISKASDKYLLRGNLLVRARTLIILVVTIFGVGLVASVTDLKALLLLESRGHAETGKVLRKYPADHGGTAAVRISLKGSEVEIVDSCYGLECNPGDSVPVVLLPDDTSVHVVGYLKQEFWTAVIATFLIAPLMFGAGAAYSLSRIEVREKSDEKSTASASGWLRYLPLFMSGGVLLSSMTGLILGNSPARFQIDATACLVAGSIAYIVWLFREGAERKVPLLLCIVFFSSGSVLLALGFF
jgi:hypothetical protein